MTRPDTANADILPFPSRARPSAAVPAEDPARRLQTALAALDAAVRRQRAAVADWRTALISLKTTLGTLDTSLHTYQARTTDLHARVETLSDTARRLQAAAEQP